MKKFIIFIFVVAGCRPVTYLGTIGDTKFYSVQQQSFSGPNITSLVSEKNCSEKTPKVAVESTFGGPGIGTVLGNASITAGTVLGAAQITGKSTAGVKVGN